jgi:hypothetical protein
VEGAALGGTHGFAQDGAGLGLAELTLDVVEMGELAEDPAEETRGLVLGFEKFPPDMGVPAHEGDAALVTTFAPMVDDAAAGDVGDLEVAGFGSAAAGFEIVDGGFVEVAVGASAVFTIRNTGG